MSREKTGKPKAMTQAELEADAIAAEIAAKAEQEGTAPVAETPVPTPEIPAAEPVKAETPVETPVPVEVKSDELAALKTAIAEKVARIAELTKRVRDEDGRRGGELTALRSQVENLGSQMRDIVAENRELRKVKQPEIPPEPDTLRTEYPELADGVDKRTQPAIEAAARAEQRAKDAEERSLRVEKTQYQRDYSEFIAQIKAAIPAMDAINVNPDFEQWCRSEDPDTGEVRQVTFDRNATNMKSGPIVKLYQKWENANKSVTPSVETPKGPAKPSIEAQVEVPKSSDSSPKAKPKAIDNEILVLKDKIFRFGTATKDDRLRYESLLDEQERAKQT
jgi:hypothetical protein